MRIFSIACLFYLGLGVGWAYNSDAQVMKEARVILSPEAETLVEIFNQIENQTDFNFVYENALNKDEVLIIDRQKSNVEAILEEISRNSNLLFKQINYTITVADKTPLTNATTPELVKIITGKIEDENGSPIPGATILVEGTNTGTATDLDGNFSIDAPSGAVLIISFIGYESLKVEVGNQTKLSITMSEDESSLDEFVVVGYGSVERREITGSIASIGRQDIVSEPTYSFESLLQGRAAGVDVVADSYRPGAGATVRIRGARSLVAGNDPLIVMDGIPIAGNLMDINPSDIESIEILKDASATAIYGSRGSNGVILITTRRGYSGGTQIEYSAFAGVQNISNRVDLTGN